MTDDPKILTFRSTLKPDPSERTITVSHPHLLLLLDAFADCAHSLYEKLELLDEVYAVLPGKDEVGMRKLLAHNNEEKLTMQVFNNLRAMWTEAAGLVLTSDERL